MISRAIRLASPAFLLVALTSVAAAAQGAAPPPAALAEGAGYTGLGLRSGGRGGPGGVVETSLPTVSRVAPGSPAERAGLQVGDVVLEADGRDPREARALWPAPGVPKVLRIRRGEEELEVVLVPDPVASRPGEQGS